MVQADVPPGRMLAAGPVLVASRAAWAEADNRALTIAALRVDGRRFVLKRFTDKPGLQPEDEPQFAVPSMAADGGRVALIRQVRRAIHFTCPPEPQPCPVPPIPYTPPASTTLIAGRAGALRRVYVVAGCERTPTPSAVAVAASGLVVAEQPCYAPARVVLRAFDGRLRRVLRTAGRNQYFGPVVGSGRWAGWGEYGRSAIARFVDVRSGRTVRREALDPPSAPFSLGPGGTVAVVQQGNGPDECAADRPRRIDTVRVGSLTGRVLQPVSPAGDGLFVTGANGVAGYFARDGRCPPTRTITLSAPGRPARTIPGFEGEGPIAYDGRLVAAGDRDAVRLAAATP